MKRRRIIPAQTPGQDRPDVCRAAVALRKGLQLSQEQMAYRVLQVTMSSLVRYERTRPPSGAMLIRFERVALAAKMPDTAKVFRDAFEQEVGGTLTEFFPLIPYPPLPPAKERETINLPMVHFIDSKRGRANIRTVWTLCGKTARACYVVQLTSLHSATCPECMKRAK